MELQEMLNISALTDYKVKTEEYPTIIRGARSIISGQDGCGKTTFALGSLAKAYAANKELVCIYIDADDKSPEQVKKFSAFLNRELQGQYLNLPLINASLQKKSADYKVYSLLSFVKGYVGKYVSKDKSYIILIDNLNHITGEFENDNSLVTKVRKDMEQSFLKLPNVQTILIAHSGKNDTGVRGASSIRAAFGEELQVRKDVDLGIVAEVRKDSEDKHGETTLYKLDLINKETFEMEYNKLTGHKIVEDKAAYQARRLGNIVQAILGYIIDHYNKNEIYIDHKAFVRAIHLLASPEDIHTDDWNFLVPNFVSKGLTSEYDKLGLIIDKHPDKHMKILTIDKISEARTKAAQGKVALTTEVENIIVTDIVQNLSTISSGQNIANDMLIELQIAILGKLAEIGSATGEELRGYMYKNKNANHSGFTKSFAKTKIVTALNNLIEKEELTVLSAGAKKTYSIRKAS